MQEKDGRTAAGGVIENFSIIAEGLFHTGIIGEDGDTFPETTRPGWVRSELRPIAGIDRQTCQSRCNVGCVPFNHHVES